MFTTLTVLEKIYSLLMMKVSTCVIVLFLTVVFQFRNAECTGKEDISLPKIFNITDLENCPTGHMYCKIAVKLRPQDNQRPPEVWKVIEKVNENVHTYFRRDMIYRTVCVEKNALGKKYSEYSTYGLDGWIEESYCFENGLHEHLSTYDKYLGIGIFSYVAFLVYCNVRTKKLSKLNEKDRGKAYKYMKVFSVSNTWSEIRRRNEGEDFRNLMCFQGLRTLAMCFVISVHNFISVLFVFSDNPEYVEQLVSGTYTGFVINSFGLIVQIFFIISAWLLAVQLKKIVKRNGKISMHDILLILLNRYFRLVPAVIIITLLHSARFMDSFLSQLLYRTFISLEQKRCLNGWWYNIFFIQNWSCFEGQICNPATWYVAVDTQLYLMVTLFFYLSEKLKISIKYFFGVAAVVAMCLQGYTVMTTTFDGLIQYNPRLLPGERTFSKPEFVYSYTRTVNSLVSYVIGFVFGSIYVEKKNDDIFNTAMKKMLWFAAFFGLPLITTFFYNYHSFRVIEAIMTVTFRPLFSLGIAIGILGMSTNTGGFIKQFLEWRPLVFLGNFTYCVYIFHVTIIFVKTSMLKQMTYFSNFYCLKNLVEDITLGFLLGIMMYIILEHPFIQLQKATLPQVKSMKDKSKGKVN